MLRRPLASLGALLFVVLLSRSTFADSLLVTGVGSPGTWTTNFTFANPTATELRVQAYIAAGYEEQCLPVCPIGQITIPANGTSSFTINGAPFNSGLLQTVYITPQDGVTFPTVRVEAVNLADPTQRIVLPVIRLSTLNARSPDALFFPSASRSASTHSNIGVGLVASDGTNPQFSVRVEVFAADGTPLGQGVFGNTFLDQISSWSNIFLVDVLGYLGIASLDNGQIRVTRLTGEGALWGEMATVRSGACSVLMTEGVNP